MVRRVGGRILARRKSARCRFGASGPPRAPRPILVQLVDSIAIGVAVRFRAANKLPPAQQPLVVAPPARELIQAYVMMHAEFAKRLLASQAFQSHSSLEDR